MFHVQLKADAGQWIKWAQAEGLHPWVIDYIIQRPDHLFSEPPKTEEPFSTPRSWHMLSDALKEYRAGGAGYFAGNIKNDGVRLPLGTACGDVSCLHKNTAQHTSPG